jgi:hypothetical protein
VIISLSGAPPNPQTYPKAEREEPRENDQKKPKLAEKTAEMTESGKGDGYHGTAEQID